MKKHTINVQTELTSLYYQAIEREDFTLALRVLKELPQPKNHDVDISAMSQDALERMLRSLEAQISSVILKKN